MEEELRWSLLIFGSCFILAILGHGLWVSRKNKKLSEQQQPRHQRDREFSEPTIDGDASVDDSEQSQYDELGIGNVRIVTESHSISAGDGNHDDDDVTTDRASHAHDVAEPDELSCDLAEQGTDDVTEPASEPAPAPTPPEPKLYGSVVTQPKPHLAKDLGATDAEHFPEPPKFLLNEGQETAKSEADDFQLHAQPSTEESDGDVPSNVTKLGDHAKKLVSRKKTRTSRTRKEPNFGDDQMRIDFDESQEQAPAAEQGAESSNSSNDASLEQEVLVLNVRGTADSPISGAALLPMLLTLGFKYGDQEIFHRHVNSDGTGPTLFSLANMYKPGSFDIDNLETFTTQGLTLFMIMPIDDPHQVFNMMHNAARKIADEFGAQVLDSRRSALTKQGLQRYIEKIREFERKRMISRH